MRRALLALTLIAWGLWFGGLVVLLLFVTRLFQNSRTNAVEAAPVLFRTFANYQLMVGMIACACATLLTLQTRRSSHAVMSLLLIGSLGAGLLIRGWTNQMEAIRAAGQSSGPEFKALHGKSSMAYTAAAALLLVAGAGFIILPPASRESRTSAGTAEA